MHLKLTNVACSGASTDSLTGPMLDLIRRWQPAQLDALTSDTRLVTLGIGANDYGLFAFISQTCPRLAEQHPGRGSCTDQGQDSEAAADLSAKLKAVTTRVTAILHLIRQRSPKAKILLVGYPQVVPAHDTCAQLPLAAVDVPFAHRVIDGLNRSLSAAARTSNVAYVDVSAATQGHDICSKTPWVAGKAPVNGGAAPWHPFAAEQQKVAQLIVAALRNG